MTSPLRGLRAAPVVDEHDAMSMLRRVALALTLVAAACTQPESIETVAEVEAVSTSSTPTTAAATTSTTAATDDAYVEFDEAQLDAGYRCVGFESPTIDAATLDAIADWEPAPESFTSTLAPESGRPIGELGDWVTWPRPELEPVADGSSSDDIGYEEALPLYVLATPLATEPLVLLASTTEAYPWPCEVVWVEWLSEFGYAAPVRDVADLSCEVTDAESGPTVFVTGIHGTAVPIRILVDGAEALSGSASPTLDHGDARSAVFEAAGWPVEPVSEAEPSTGASFIRHLAGRGADGPVSVTASVLGVDGWIDLDCGSGRMITVDDVDVTCSLRLRDGIPEIVVSDPSVFSTLRRNGADLGWFHSVNGLDFTAPRGEEVTYSLDVIISGEPLEVPCGSIDVPAELDDRAALLHAREAATFVGGPNVYWEHAFVCPDCEPTLGTSYFLVNEEPPAVDGLPHGHPGRLSPFTVHDHLIAAIDAGREVTVEYLERGWIGSWEVDGVGIRTTCLIVDTLPPELGATYCNYDGG